MSKVTLTQLLESWDAVDNLELALEIVSGTRLPSGFSIHEFIGALQTTTGAMYINGRGFRYAMGGLSSVYFYNTQEYTSHITEDYSLMYSAIDDIVVSQYHRGMPVVFKVKTFDSMVTVKIDQLLKGDKYANV